MRQSRLHCGRVAWLLVSGLLIGVPAIGQQTPSDNAEIIHVLNRISFGPRPGDVEAVKQVGLHNYIERQLHPETIDDSAVEQELAQFNLLQMTPGQLSQMYIEDKKDHAKKLHEKFGQDQPKMADNGQSQGQTAPHAVADADQNPAQNPGNFQHQGKKKGAPGQGGQGGGKFAAADQLDQAKLVRAVDSKRQLQEVLVDFWSNHFNIDVKKGPDAVFKVVDDRDVIRPHIFGKFRDLLEASAKSPAMLFYLDNVNSTVARTISPAQQQRQVSNQQKLFGTAAPVHPPFKAKKGGGINENYAREIMELHTLGVDAGYTQQDVQEIARCFTGWSIDRSSGTFTFHAFAHDNGPKVVLGHHIPAGGGIQDGETVLDILCAHPACAHFISRELCQRFVADDPPAALVDRIADVFTKTGGDLRQVTEAILTSPEFLSPADYGNKIKSPLEFTVSAIRASDSTILAKTGPAFRKDKGKPAGRMAQYGRQTLSGRIGELGEPLFSCVPPTGYGEVSKKWVSPGALIERLNFATALTQQELSDIRFDPEKILVGTDLDKPGTVLDQCVAKLLQGNITENTRKVLEQNALPAPGSNQTVDPTKLIALIIGSPEFQRK